jgi:hypothetical protein
VNGETSFEIRVAPGDLGAGGAFLLSFETDDEGVLVRGLRRAH